MQAHMDPADRGEAVSILIETANLSTAELDSLSRCLRSVEQQSYPIEAVHEVLVLDSSDIPSDGLREVCRQFPWVELRAVGPRTGYGDLKAQSGAHASGDIIVLCDSDCRYEPGWLDALLESFREQPGVDIVSGETTTPIDGPYGLAIALTFVFPRFSHQTRLEPALWYWANNVAVRRTAFEGLPLPAGLPLYRGQNVVHGNLLRHHGKTVWRQPRARAIHQLPLPSQLVPRYMAFGDDMVTLASLVEDRSGRFYRRGNEPDAQPIGRVAHLLQRTRSVFGEEPRRLVHLPLALPVVLVCVISYLAGMARAQVRLRRRTTA